MQTKRRKSSKKTGKYADNAQKYKMTIRLLLVIFRFPLPIFNLLRLCYNQIAMK